MFSCDSMKKLVLMYYSLLKIHGNFDLLLLKKLEVECYDLV